jgi:hypothetical protein
MDDDEVWIELKRSIGSVVVAAGQLESTLRNILRYMHGGSQHWLRTSLVVQGFGTSQVRERCERLAQVVLGGALQEDVFDWLVRVGEAQKVRNDVVHADWASKIMTRDRDDWYGPVSITSRVRKRSQGGGMDSVVTERTPAELDELAGTLSALNVEGNRFLVDMQGWLRAERETHSDLSPWDRPAPDPSSYAPGSGTGTP